MTHGAESAPQKSTMERIFEDCGLWSGLVRGRFRRVKYVAACCSVLQCVAVCCSVLQCVAVCCSVLQCVVVRRQCGLWSGIWRIEWKIERAAYIEYKMIVELTFKNVYLLVCVHTPFVQYRSGRLPRQFPAGIPR